MSGDWAGKDAFLSYIHKERAWMILAQMMLDYGAPADG
jgi:hypothetical protein